MTDYEDRSSSRHASVVRRARVLIVDDHELLRVGMRMMIDNESDLKVCGEAAEEAEAVGMFCDLQPDLVIVDIALKSGNGIELN